MPRSHDPARGPGSPADGPAATRIALRAVLRRARRAIPPDSARHAAEAVCGRLLMLPALASPLLVGAYVAADGELDLAPTLLALAQRGNELALPRVDRDADGAMTFLRWQPGDPLVRSPLGIAEPAAGPPVAPTVLLVPCVGVDGHGTRLGSGRGYYDRWLQQRPGTFTIAVVHDVQLVERIAPEPWDVAMKAVVTPSRVLNCSPWPDTG